MYNSADIAKRIKYIAKEQQISIKEMLDNCNLGINTLSNMNSGRMPLSDTVAKISDYLSVSVDFLLGRTDFTEIIVSDDQVTALTPEEAELISSYRLHPEMHEAVKRLLPPTDNKSVHISYKLAAYGGKNEVTEDEDEPKTT